MNMNTISTITISAICTSLLTLLVLSHNQSVVSAWSIYTTNNNKLVYPSISRWSSSHRIANQYHSTTVLYSTTPEDDIDDDDIINNGNIEEVDIISERKRKRDIFKRTLGLSSTEASGDDSNEVKKLNTDNLFKGMPPINSILGTSSSATNIVGNMPEDISSPSPPPQSSQSTSEQTEFEKQGQLQKELDLLTPSEKAELELKYNTMKLQSEGLVSDELDKGKEGRLGSDIEGMDKLNITTNEAKKIVDYAIEEEKLLEQRTLNNQKKLELINSWEQEGILAEQSIDNTISSASSEEERQEIINSDGISREIINNAEQREIQDTTIQKQKDELDFYKRQMLQRKEVEGVVEKATSSNSGEDMDTIYEETLNQIQSSRKNKLGPQSLGVLSNSIALEEGREYVTKQKEQKGFLKEVEREAGLVDASDEEIGKFFKPPTNVVEERMYRSIVRQIVDKRIPEYDEDESSMELNDMKSDIMSMTEEYDEDSSGETLDPAEEGWDGSTFASSADNKKKKYQLSAKETVEAYKLLNLWREVQSEQDAMEVALGMKDDERTAKPRALNKIEPFFLYQEDTEEKRAKEKEELTKVLQKGLQSDDDVEKSSNDLLMKELLEGGITKDRAVRLLDKLMSKATDDTIRESLEELRGTLLEEEDGWMPDDAEEDRQSAAFLRKKKAKSNGPIDLSGVFRTSDNIDEEEDSAAAATPLDTESTQASTGGTQKSMPAWVGSEVSFVDDMSGGLEEEEAVEEEEALSSSLPPPPPPNTPFFSDSEGTREGDDESSPTGGMFGTYEEQRLQNLASKVGAQTEEEIEELRKNMEALKKAEEMADAQLSDDEFDVSAASEQLGIDLTAVDLDNDDDDQIMSILGKRPVTAAAYTSDSPKRAVLELNEDEQEIQEDIIVDASGNLKRMEEKKETDVVDDIFRWQTAGKQYQDREARDADEAAFRDFMKMEEEAISSVDSTTADETSLSEDIDVDEYADDIMSEIKPRPSRPKREDFMSLEDLQRERKKESMFGVGYDEDPFPTSNESQQAAPSGDGSMPEWFRKEQETLGIKAEDMSDDDFDEARREWEREERQRKADEYLKGRGEGISISDVLGREYFGPMDEPDYKDTRDEPDYFKARKEMLLGYTELTVEDINNVVDFKVDPLATGYNPYLSRVQRPFSEYGAIFRLEGVLVDMIGMHAKAWKAVADKHMYTIDSSDEIRQASLYKPEDAVREVFRWTDDIFELRDIAETFHVAFQEAFNNWLESDSSVVTASIDQDSPAGVSSSSTTTIPKATPSDDEMNSMYYLAWSKLANNLDRTAPSSDQVNQGIMGQDWEVAVKDIFGWSEDANEVYGIVVAYDEILQADYRILLQKYGIDLDKIDSQEEESLFGLDFPDMSVQEDITEWLDVLREVDMPIAIASHLESSQLDSVLIATGLADYFPSDRRVSLDDNYENERSELLGAALRLEQRPDQCIVFDNTPNSANEAHEVMMKCISFVNHYARYELLTADLSVGYVGDLELNQLVKLFDKREDLEPLLELDVTSGMQKEQRKVKTAFWDE